MLLVRSADRTWRRTPYAGIEMCVLRGNDEHGGAVLLKFPRAARFPLHDHPGGEELYVLEGRITVGEHALSRGDYLWTEPGGRHDAIAEQDTVVLVTTPKGIKVLE
jgi:quercetin dioxygenase-like cupin family protein